MVVGYEIGAASMDGSRGGAKTFFLCRDSADFLLLMKRKSKMYWHEYLVPNRPVKLFVDLDDKRMLPGWDDFVRGVRDNVDALLETKPAPPHVWTAHTATKYSTHLIWSDVWFDCTATLRAFILDLDERMRRDERLDTSVVSATGYKSMRVPYSSKMHMNNPLVPLDGPCEFNAERMLESMLTVGRLPDSRLLTSVEFPCVEHARRVRAIGTVDESPIRKEALDRLESWIKRHWGVKKIKATSDLNADTGEWIWYLTPGVWCPRARRMHASNNMYLRGRMSLDCLVQIETLCLDPGCGGYCVNSEIEWGKMMFFKKVL